MRFLAEPHNQSEVDDAGCNDRSSDSGNADRALVGQAMIPVQFSSVDRLSAAYARAPL